MSMIARLLAAAPSSAIGDLFATTLYTGNGGSQTITNNLDLAGRGGFVWTKNRGSANHNIGSPALGTSGSNTLRTNDGGAAFGDGTQITAFGATGYTLGAYAESNENSESFVSWAFASAPRFCDVVTYTGTGVARTVSHSLGEVPGVMIVKRTDATANWAVYHRANTAQPETEVLTLNTSDEDALGPNVWNDTAPTSSVFTVGTDAKVNALNGEYVAILFAHNELVQCGSYTGNGSASGPNVDLGFRPQWVMIKRSNGTGDWCIFDTQRLEPGNPEQFVPLFANASDVEDTTGLIEFTDTGFDVVDSGTNVNASGGTYVYVAIRAEGT